MKLTDLLLVELEYDNLKLFNQSCEEALFAMGDDWMDLSSRLCMNDWKIERLP